MATLLPGMESSDEGGPVPLINDDDDDSSDDGEDMVDSSFQFGGILGEDGGSSAFMAPYSGSYQVALDSLEQQQKTSVPRMDVASLIRAKRKTLLQQSDPQKVSSDNDDDDRSSSSSSDDSSQGNSGSESSSDDESGKDDTNESSSKQRNLESDVLKLRAGDNNKLAEAGVNDDASDGGDSGNEDDTREAAKAAAFFDQEASTSTGTTAIQNFHELALSRPVVRGISAMGFVQPTPIQAAAIPLALRGQDICASAVTGSGKTAAFGIPILERLARRAHGRATIRAVILTPTRELAAQCLGMLTSLAQFMTSVDSSRRGNGVRLCLVVGGAKNGPAQAAELRTRPDIIVATPGRLLDHVTNSAGVELEHVECLVLDEADRLLDLGFQDEVHEIIKSCPPAERRQTLLFSATMNTKVDDLIRLCMKKPARVRVTDKTKDRDLEVAPRLEQEFVRVRAGNEGVNREGMLLALLTRTYTKRTIVFFDTKVTAHRLMILCGLCGIKCSELHGNLTQQQRLTALEDFRKGEVDVLLATDLAARGLDIDGGVQAVVNFEMPSQVETYIHRIGRTARAGRKGGSCTLIGEGRRYLMKEIIKDAETKKKTDPNSTAGIIRSRTIPPAVISHFVAKISSLEEHVEEVLQAEAVARMDRMAEMEAVKAQNLIEHADSIKSRPRKEWFASEKQKKLTKEEAAEKQRRIAEMAGTGSHRMTRKKRRAREAMSAFHDNDDDDQDGEASAVAPPLKGVKAAVREKKREHEEREHAIYQKSVHDMDVQRQALAAKKRKTVGDSSLFDDERVHSKSASNERKATEQQRAKTSYTFTEFDPNKKFGKKRGHKAFKSKSKYKRRK